jgi:LruC domain-containing protein
MKYQNLIFLILIYVSYDPAAAPTEESTQQNDNGSYTFTQKISGQSTPPHYTAPSGYGFDVYSYFDQDYEWQHSFPSYNAANVQILSATLLIRGYDVDSETFHGTNGEYDGIAFDMVGVNPGLLQGTNGTWSETTFDVPINRITDDGLLKVFLDIDMNHTSRTWATTLDYSLLTINYIETTSQPPSQPEFSATPSSSAESSDDLVVTITGPTPADPDYDTVTYTYRWFVDVGQGYLVDDEFAGKNNHTGNTVPASQTIDGEKWLVEVYPYDSNGLVGTHTTFDFGTIGGHNIDTDSDGINDNNDDFPTDPDRAFSTRTPNSGYYTLAFEDKWPEKGDYDFNDLVIKYSFTLVTDANNLVKDIKFNGGIKARGGSRAAGFALAFDGTDQDNVQSASVTVGSQQSTLVPEAGHTNSLVAVLVPNVYTVTPPSGSSEFYNTESVDSRNEISLDMTITLTNPIAQASLGSVPYNPFMYYTNDRGREIHLPNKPPTALANTALFGTADDSSDVNSARYYKTSTNLPWALDISSSWKHPYEYIDVSNAYPNLESWAESSGVSNTNWYDNPDLTKCWSF